MAINASRIADACAKQLAEPQTSMAATVLSCALTVMDVVQTIFSVGTNPVFFGFGAFTGFAVSVALNNAMNDTNIAKREEVNTAVRALYSLLVGAIPSSLVQISSIARRMFCSPIVLGFRCGALAAHTYYHIQEFRQQD